MSAAPDRGAVVITGSSTGIGRACALRLDRAGFRVFAGVRKAADGESLRAESSERLEPLICDVVDAATITAAAERVREATDGRLAGLVNNAGVAVPGPVEAIDLDALRRQFEVNVVGQVAVTQAFLPMLRAARGRVVFMSSIGARRGLPYLSPYNASKAAIGIVGDSLRQEMRPFGVGVSVIEPGAIATPMWGKGQAEAPDIIAAMDPRLRELYGERLDRIQGLSARTEARGQAPDAVAAGRRARADRLEAQAPLCGRARRQGSGARRRGAPRPRPGSGHRARARPLVGPMVALVTGASSGIGEATARRLAREPGAELVLVARREERLQRLASELGGATVIAADLTEAEAPARIAAAVEAEHGRLDLLVNNAGAAWRGKFGDGGWEHVRQHMELNFDAVVRLTEALLPLLRSSAPSAIVNVASTAGRVSRPNSGSYSASKFALAGWTDALSLEERANGVHVGLVLPGFVATEGFPQRELTERRATRWLVSKPERVADAIVEAGPGGKAERYVPRAYGLAAAARILTPRLVRRVTGSGSPALSPSTDARKPE